MSTIDHTLIKYMLFRIYLHLLPLNLVWRILSCITRTPYWPENVWKNLVLVYNAQKKAGKSVAGHTHHLSGNTLPRVFHPPPSNNQGNRRSLNLGYQQFNGVHPPCMAACVGIDSCFALKVCKKIKSCLSQPLISIRNYFDVITNKQTCLNCVQWFRLYR